MRKCFTRGEYSNYVSKGKTQARDLPVHLQHNSILVTYAHTHTIDVKKKEKGRLHTETNRF